MVLIYKDNIFLNQFIDYINNLNPDSFRVKLHQRYVEIYKDKNPWMNLGVQEVSDIKLHISPLLVPEEEDELARRFDYLIYAVNLALLQKKDARKPIKSIIKTAEELSKLYTISQVKEQKEVIERVLTDGFWEGINIFELEMVREALRDLIKYIKKTTQQICINGRTL